MNFLSSQIFISIIVVSSGGGCSKHLFYCFPPSIYFFSFFFPGKERTPIVFISDISFVFPKLFDRCRRLFLSLAFCRNIFIRQVIRFHTKTLTIREENKESFLVSGLSPLPRSKREKRKEKSISPFFSPSNYPFSFFFYLLTDFACLGSV